MNNTEAQYKEVKKLLIDLDMEMGEFAELLGVTRDAIYKALKGNPWLGKLRERIATKCKELRAEKLAA
jgi:predicted DNA-binding protein YlxM (UPF0122 family)